MFFWSLVLMAVVWIFVILASRTHDCKNWRAEGNRRTETRSTRPRNHCRRRDDEKKTVQLH